MCVGEWRGIICFLGKCPLFKLLNKLCGKSVMCSNSDKASNSKRQNANCTAVCRPGAFLSQGSWGCVF